MIDAGPHGGLRTFHHKSTCLTTIDFTEFSNVNWSRNNLKSAPNETFVAHRVVIDSRMVGDTREQKMALESHLPRVIYHHFVFVYNVCQDKACLPLKRLQGTLLNRNLILFFSVYQIMVKLPRTSGAGGTQQCFERVEPTLVERLYINMLRSRGGLVPYGE
jgi:hypothetical protein